MNEAPPATVEDYDPGSMPAASLASGKNVWYRRPWFLITAAVVVTLAISIVTDLPHHITPAQDAADQNGVVTEINNDLQPCILGVSQSFGFFRDFTAGRLSADQIKGIVKPYLQQNQTACSFASGPVYDLTNNIAIVHSAAGREVQKVLAKVVTWATSDGDGSIKDIETLIARPGDAKALADLGRRETFLAQDREAALVYLDRASQTLGLPLRALKLPSLSRLPGT
jgi:hypothetical protein